MSAAQGMQMLENAETIWGLALQPTGCPQCGQVYLLPQGEAGVLCPNCAGADLQPQPAHLRSEPPEKIVPFQVQRAGLKAIFGQFVRGVWLHCDEFNPDTLLERAVPVFVPMWLVDSDLQGSWQAEMGFDYQVKSSQEAYSGGSWRTREVLENRVRWEPRLGQVDLRYDNSAVPAMSDHERLSQRVGNYNLKSSRAYDPGLVGSAALRAPDVDTAQAWPLAKDALEQRLAQDCLQAAGAQHLRRFSCKISYTQERWTQLLMPLYFSWYSDDDGRRYPVYVNGQSGRVGGIRLASQRKGWQWAGILAAAAVGVFLLALLGFLLTSLFPPAAAIGAVLAGIALLVGAAAIIPAVWPWQWNRRQPGVRNRDTGR